MNNILIVEDEVRISSFIAKGLTAEGYLPTVVADGNSGLDFALTGDFDLVILDIGLPGIDGFAVLSRLSAERPDIPVIVLTARDSAADTVAALEGGAADFMAKPFRFDVLLARIRLRVRTHTEPTPQLALPVGDLLMDFRTRQASLAGQEIELSAREFTLLEVFVRNPDQVFSREQLLTQIWGSDLDSDSNVVDVYVGYLRKKFGSSLIHTVRGRGYRLSPVTDMS